jgi:hypothetical protein
MNKIRLIESLPEVIGFQIGIYTNDGKQVNGILTNVKDDFLTVINDKNETFFFNLDKIQAFSKNTRKFKVDHKHGGHIYEQSLMELIDNYKYSWITVNCLNNLSFSGVLSIIADDHIILTVKEEKLYVQKDHIISFFPETLKDSQPRHTQQEHTDKTKSNDKKEDSTQKKKEEKKQTNKQEKKEEKKQHTSQEKKQDAQHDHSKEDRKNSNKKTEDDEHKKHYDSAYGSEQGKANNENENHNQNESSDNDDKRQNLSNTFKNIVRQNLNYFDSPLRQFANQLLSSSSTNEAEDDKSDNHHMVSSHNDKHQEDSLKTDHTDAQKKVPSSWWGSGKNQQAKSYYGVPYNRKSKNKRRKANGL